MAKINNISALSIILSIGILTACDNPGGPIEPEFAGASLGADAPSLSDPSDAALLSGLLSTGRNGDETLSYWQCSETSVTGSSEQYSLRLWSNQSGFQQEQRLVWASTTGANFQLSFSDSDDDRSYSNAELLNTNELFDTLVATGSNGNTLNCNWSGPSRFDPAQATFEDDSSNLLVALLQGLEERSWGCTLGAESGSVQSLVLQLDANGEAWFDGTARRWYSRLNTELYLSDGKQLDLLTAITYRLDTDGTFSARYRDQTLDCLVM